MQGMIKKIMDNFSPSIQHTLVLVNIRLTGEEEWLCPICDHRLLRTHDPDQSLKILVPGNELFCHASETQASDHAMSREDLNQIAPWVAWIDQVDFDTLQAEEIRPN